VRAIAEETNTGDIECVEGGEGGLNPVAGDNVAFVEDTATATVADVAPPEVSLSLYGGADCIEEDSLVTDFNNQVTVTVTPDGDDLLTQIVISGFQSDWTYDLTGLDTDGATLSDSDPSDGSIAISVPSLPGYTGSFAVQPPADSDVDHPTMTVTATAVDPTDPSLTANGAGTLDVHVDAVADPVTVEVIVSDSADPSGSFSPNETGTVQVIATFGDADDGSENHKVTVTIPAAFAIVALVGLPAGVTAEVNDETGEIVFTVGAGVTSFDYTFEVTAPDTVSSEDNFVFKATATATETNTTTTMPGDVECTEDNNTAEASDEQVVPGSAGAIEPVLIVGENVNDVDGQTEDHRIQNSDGPPNGEIVGTNADDVLIGDVGGGNLVGKTMNLALVLDTSGSMDAEITFDGVPMTRIEALDKAVEQLLQNLADTDGATVRVHMVNFASGVKGTATFNIIVNGVVDAAALQAAKDFVLAEGDDPLAVASGNTNYEAGFTAALNWFSNDANTLDDPDFNQTIFISDGVPNRVYEGNTSSGSIWPGSNQAAIDHVLGDSTAPNGIPDTVSEFDGLLGSFKGVNGTVDAIGINVSDTAKGLLDQVDDDGNADDITTGEQLVDVLDDLTQANNLAAVGDDVIIGSDGGDLIFGDTLFTDDLAAAEGIALPPGSGWSVIEQLIAGNFFDAFAGDTTNQKIMSFLRDPANQEAYNLGGETLTAGGVGREGGHDTITGGAGNDTIFGQEGNDVIDGGDGDDLIIGGSGNDTMTGGDGSDTFRWTDATQDGEADTITDFQIGAGGDVIDLAGLLSGVPGGADGADLDAYLDFSFAGGNTTITVDFDGGGTGTESSTITLQGVDLSTIGSGSDEDIINSLLSTGNLQAE
jgi:Ca2+-binding RTX toxin-like protein